jgi:hypothetical protein
LPKSRPRMTSRLWFSGAEANRAFQQPYSVFSFDYLNTED